MGQTLLSVRPTPEVHSSRQAAVRVHGTDKSVCPTSEVNAVGAFARAEHIVPLAHRNDALPEDQHALPQVNRDIAELNDGLPERNDDLAERDDDLAGRNDGLAERNDNLAERNDDLAERNNELAERNVGPQESIVAVCESIVALPEVIVALHGHTDALRGQPDDLAELIVGRREANVGVTKDVFALAQLTAGLTRRDVGPIGANVTCAQLLLDDLVHRPHGQGVIRGPRFGVDGLCEGHVLRIGHQLLVQRLEELSPPHAREEPLD